MLADNATALTYSHAESLVIKELMRTEVISFKEALSILYKSKTYQKMCRYENGFWMFSEQDIVKTLNYERLGNDIENLTFFGGDIYA